MSVFFTSDLHLGWEGTAEKRGFSSVGEHDDTILHNLRFLTKRDKLFILGDVAKDHASLMKLTEVSGVKDLVLGNHDLMNTQVYLKVFNHIYGIVRYKNFWLSHCPIHPQEMYRCVGNIHGHIHSNSNSENIGMPYFNVNIDFHNNQPVAWVDILSKWGM